MPFTPIHMGPGILFKAIFQGSFSLMVFGWSQIIMDIQPLIVLFTGEGHLHGFTHTYVGAVLLAIFSALSGKYLGEFALKLMKVTKEKEITILWKVSFFSATLGCFSHVLLDSFMHSDIQPLYPFTLSNPLLDVITTTMLHKICLYSGLVGIVLFYLVIWFKKSAKK